MQRRLGLTQLWHLQNGAFANLNEQDFGEIHTFIDDRVFGADAALYDEGQTAVGPEGCCNPESLSVPRLPCAAEKPSWGLWAPRGPLEVST